MSSRSLLHAMCAVAVIAPTARAQSRYALSPFASMNGSLPGNPALFGASLTAHGSSLGGMLGMRVGGGYDVRALTGSELGAENARGWAADVDAVLSPGRLPVIGPLLSGFLPTFFTGVGLEGVRREAGESSSTVVTSYGFGVSRALGALAIETEARRRIPVSWSGSEEVTSEAQKGWEYRIGFSIPFGGRATPAVPVGIPYPSRSPLPGAPTGATTARASQVLATADRHVGTRYTYGGTSPSAGFDCSGFVQYVFRRHGVTLPRTSRQQSAVGRSLPARTSGLRAGDLLFFSQSGGVVDHVAMYAGGQRIIHSSSSGGGVRYDDLGSTRGRWFIERLVGVRRVLGDGQSFVDPGIVASLDSAAGAPARSLLDPPDRAPRPE